MLFAYFFLTSFTILIAISELILFPDLLFSRIDFNLDK